VCTCHALHLPPYLRQLRVLRCTTQFVTALARVPLNSSSPFACSPRCVPLHCTTFVPRLYAAAWHLPQAPMHIAQFLFQDVPAYASHPHHSLGSISLHSAVLHANRLPEPATSYGSIALLMLSVKKHLYDTPFNTCCTVFYYKCLVLENKIHSKEAPKLNIPCLYPTICTINTFPALDIAQGYVSIRLIRNFPYFIYKISFITLHP
jgi:hypothetical protein